MCGDSKIINSAHFVVSDCKLLQAYDISPRQQQQRFCLLSRVTSCTMLRNGRVESKKLKYSGRSNGEQQDAGCENRTHGG